MIDRLLDRIDTWQRARRWAAFPFGVVKKFGDDQAGNLAALVAYYAFFSLFPLLLLFTVVVSRLLGSHPDLRQDLLDSALGQFPVIGDQLRDNVGDLPGSGVAVAIGLIGALWGGMGALMAMQTALNGVWNVPLRSRPNFVKARLKSIAMLLVIGVGLIGLTVAGGLSRTVGHVPLVGWALSFVVLAALGTLLFLVAFKLLTDLPLGWRDLLAGAVVAAIGWAVLQSVGAAFVRRQVEGAGATAGVFAVVIGLLSWLYLQSQLTVLAAEVNVVRRERLWPRSLTGRNLTEADQRALARYAGVEQRVEGQQVIIDLRPPAVETYVRTPAPPDPA